MSSPWRFNFQLSAKGEEISFNGMGLGYRNGNFDSAKHFLSTLYKELDNHQKIYSLKTAEEKFNFGKRSHLNEALYKDLLLLLQLLYQSDENAVVTSYQKVLQLLLAIKIIHDKLPPELQSNHEGDRNFGFRHKNANYPGHYGHWVQICCWSVPYAPCHSDNLDETIQYVKERKNEAIDQPLVNLIGKVQNRWQYLAITDKKHNILCDFKNFHEEIYKSNELPNKLLSPADIVEQWAKQYMAAHQNENPFSILSQHRNHLFTFFNPRLTDSMKFFYKFIGNEKISSDLQKLLNNEPVQGRDLEEKLIIQQR